MIICVAGCGFRTLGGGDGGVDADLSTAGTTPDLSTPATGGTGPGPRGSLPSGFCCTDKTQCRSRVCAGGACSDSCDTDEICIAHGAKMTCDQSSQLCAPAAGFVCLDAQTFHYGTKAFGACCASGFATSGDECVGGLCQATGPDANPFRCTQGCSPSASDECPSGFDCMIGWCWPNDPNSTYTCQ